MAESAPSTPSSVPLLELREWRERYGLVAGITTAEHGFSLNLPPDTIDEPPPGWRTFQDAFRDRFPAILFSRQVHGVEIAWHEGVAPGWQVLAGVDGHATGQPGVLLTIGVADCIPVYLAAPAVGVVELLHAGWRGTAGGILEQGIDRLVEAAQVDVSSVVIHCGIGICGACYEVDYEVAKRLVSVPPSGKSHIDLRLALADRARAKGVGAVSVSPWCTAHDRGRFHSHRGSGGGAGRMLAYLGRPST